MKDLFAYHPPTDATAPKYAKIRAAQDACEGSILAALDPGINFDSAGRFEVVNDAARRLYDTIEETCPKSADTTTALRSVRLVRMRANENIQTGSNLDWRTPLIDARHWACAAIALDDEP